MAFIKGEERILHIKIDGVYVPVACLTSNSISENTEFLETTTRQNAGHTTQIPIKRAYELSFSAIHAEDADLVSKAGLKTLRSLMTNETLFEWKLEALGRNFTDGGFGYMQSITETAEAEGFVQFEGVIIGNGMLVDVNDVSAPSVPFLNPVVPGQVDFTFDLSWTESQDNLGIEKYNIYRAGGTTSQSTLYASVAKDQLTFTDLGVIPGVLYGYWVEAIDITGLSSGLSNKRLVTYPIPLGGSQPVYLEFQDGTSILGMGNTPIQTQQDT